MKRPCSGFRPIKQATSYHRQQPLQARISTTAVDAGGWWKSEFTLDLANEGDGTIVYRENKNVSDNLSELGYECNVKAGQKVHINFTTGKGKVE